MNPPIQPDQIRAHHGGRWRRRRLNRNLVVATGYLVVAVCLLTGLDNRLAADPPAEPTHVAGRAVAQYAEQLQDSDRVVRLRAVKSLGAFGQSAGDPLVGALEHDDPAIRYTAAVHLGRIAGKPLQSAQPTLKSMADSDSSAAVRLAVSFALCRLGQLDDHLPLLITAVQSGNRARACSAAELIGDLGAAADAAVPPLQKVWQQNRPGAKGGDYHIGGAAQNALRKIGSEPQR